MSKFAAARRWTASPRLHRIDPALHAHLSADAHPALAEEVTELLVRYLEP